MMDDSGEFDDPGFRAAVRKAMGSHTGSDTAPAGLRRRVTALFAAAAPPAPADDAAFSSPSRRSTNSRWAELKSPRTMALAAGVLIAIGFAVLQVASFFELTGPSVPAYAARPVSFPASFAAALVATHDHCAKLSDHHFIAGSDPVALRDQLTRAEGVPVSAINPGDGWQFRGAGLCTVEHTRAAHLLFVRGGEAISIFSLPAPQSCSESAYSQVVANHPLVGFTRHGALYCVVGSDAQGRLTLDKLEPVVSKVKSSVGLAACDELDEGELVQTAALPAPLLKQTHAQHSH